MFQTLRYTELVTTFISSEMNFYLLLNLIFTLLLALPGTDAAAKKSLPLPSISTSNTNSRPASSQTNRSTSTILAQYLVHRLALLVQKQRQPAAALLPR